MPRYRIEFECEENDLEDTLANMAMDGFRGVLQEVDECYVPAWIDRSVNCSVCQELFDERECFPQEEGSICKNCMK